MGSYKVTDFLADHDQGGERVSVTFECPDGTLDSGLDLASSGFDGCLGELRFGDPHRREDESRRCGVLLLTVSASDHATASSPARRAQSIA